MMDGVELDSLTNDSYNASARSSFDPDYFSSHICDVQIWDEAANIIPVSASSLDPAGDHFMIHGSTTPSAQGYTPNDAGGKVPEELLRRLKIRDAGRGRWINVVGWSESLMSFLAENYLSNHGCLDLKGPSPVMFGGPMPDGGEQEFIWLHTKVWFMGPSSLNWSSIEEVGLRMIVIMPSRSRAGTIITNFLGRFTLAQRLSKICTDALIENHPYGSQALGCGWIMAYAMLRTIVEQTDRAFEIFDPVSPGRRPVPHLEDLPSVLDKANNLARLDRYLSEIEELTSFFEAVQKMSQAESTADNSTAETQQDPVLSHRHLTHRASLERSRLEQKIRHSQRLCRTYLSRQEISSV